MRLRHLHSYMWNVRPLVESSIVVTNAVSLPHLSHTGMPGFPADSCLYIHEHSAYWTRIATYYFGGCNSLLNQRVTVSDSSGSGPSQLKHWNVRCPLPPGGSAKIRYAPQWGQVGR